MKRMDGSRTDKWAPNQCFELYVQSPYQDPASYRPFHAAVKPKCFTPKEDGIKLECKIKPGSIDTLQFWFTDIPEERRKDKVVWVDLTNFHTPWSGQTLRNMEIRYYSDKDCMRGQRQMQLPDLDIQPAVIPAVNVQVTTSSKTLGYQENNNTLIISFMPATTMALRGKGTIEIAVPYWYSVNTARAFMYSRHSNNKCKSDCMTIRSSKAFRGTIRITYQDMKSKCFKKKKIVIKCQQFYNPIYQKEWDGFHVVTYDAEKSPKRIDASESAALDATNFKAARLLAEGMKIQPQNLEIGASSQWTIFIKVPIPMELGCYVKMFYPKDLEFDFQKITAHGFFRPKRSDQLTRDLMEYNALDSPSPSLTFKGCNQFNGIGLEPYGRLLVSYFTTPGQIKDSGDFKVFIYKDEALTQLIAYQEKGGKIMATDLQPGTVSDITISPTNMGVQEVTSHKITFVPAHSFSDDGKIRIKMPEGLLLPPINKQLKIEPYGENNKMKATVGTIISSSVIEIQDVFGPGSDKTMEPEEKIEFFVHGVRNQPSTKDAGGMKVTTFTKINGEFYEVDNGETKKSFIAEAGELLPIADADGDGKPLIVSDPVTFSKTATWTLRFRAAHRIPGTGYIKVEAPPEVVFSPDSTMSGGTCNQWSCPKEDATSTQIVFRVPNELAAGQEIKIDLTGIENPRTTKPTGTFKITTYDTDKTSEIDIGYDQNTAMTIPGELGQFSATQSNVTNGDINKYEFSMQSEIPLYNGDKLSFKMPAELQAPPKSEDLACTGKEGFIEIECEISGNNMVVKFKKLASATGTFSWSADKIRNPISTKPSSSFSNIIIQDSENYSVAKFSGKTDSITNDLVANIQKYKLNQGNISVSAETIYTIDFTPINAIPKTGSIQISWPQQVEVTSDFTCTVRTNRLFSQTEKPICNVNQESRTITITDIFSEVSANGFSDQVSMEFGGMKNPKNNKDERNGFIIMTYEDPRQTFTMDKLDDYLMMPRFECEYPCKECDNAGGRRNFCTSCWPSSGTDPGYLMQDKGQCLPRCDMNYTSDGKKNKICERCDDSCNGCHDNGEIGDKKSCIECSPEYVYRQNGTNLCHQECSGHLFKWGDRACGVCKMPCKQCMTTASTCTACYPDHKKSLTMLWKNQCIFECPKGFTLQGNKCEPCKSPCSTCHGTIDNCLTCDGEKSTRFVSSGKCYQDCPKGTVLNADDDINCIPCEQEGCAMCEFKDPTRCLLCKKNLFVFEGKCLAVCPKGYKVNNPPTACRLLNLQDMGVIYFPFLTMAVIITLVCICGMFKKKAVWRQGRRVKVSEQNTVTAILAGIAPLQFMAVCMQWALCFVFKLFVAGVNSYFVMIFILCINLAFLITYCCKFHGRYLPKQKMQMVLVKELEMSEAKKRYMLNNDHEFGTWYPRHDCWSMCCNPFLTLCCSFKCNKMYYSHFYALDMFKARWTDVSFYRKMLMWFGIAHFLLVDCYLIGISVTGMLHQDWNQLYITMIETFLLSVIGVVLGTWELYKLKDELAYNEKDQKKGLLKVQGGLDDDLMDKDERHHMMKGLLAKVKRNQNLFLNNKLDELLNEFGDRKCKSMINLPTGWPQEDDPREIITMPLSPAQQEQYDGEYKFTKEDAYNLYDDNVYAEAKEARKFTDGAVGADQGQREFIEALQRKTGDVFTSQDDGADHKKRKIRGRQRGRKNKYVTQIDAEDEEEAEAVSQSADDRAEEEEAARLAVIREQEEEEEAMRRQLLEQQQRQEAEKLAKKQRKADEDRRQKEREDQEHQDRLAREAKEEQDRMEADDKERRRQQELEQQRLSLLNEEQRDQELKDQAELKRKELEAESSLKARAEYDAYEAARKTREEEEDAAQAKIRQEDDTKQRQLDEQDRERKRDEEARLQAERDEADLRRKQAETEEAERKRRDTEATKHAKALEDAEKAREAQRLNRAEKDTAKEQERLEREQQRAIEEAARAEQNRVKAEQEEKLRRSTEAKLHALEKENDARKRADDERANRDAADQQQRQKEEEDRLLAEKRAAEEAEAARLKQQALQREKEALEKAKNQAKDAEEKARLENELLKQELERAKAEKDVRVKAEAQQQLNAEMEADREASKARALAQQKVREAEDLKRFEQQLSDEGEGKGAGHHTGEPNASLLSGVNNSQFEIMDQPLQDFIGGDAAVQVPPDHERRNFNIQDILGDFDCDEKGNIIVLQDEEGNIQDKTGRPTNERGYLRDPATGDIIENYQSKKMFSKSDLDERGEVPAPFCLEKYNFNPHALMGDFDWIDTTEDGSAPRKGSQRGSNQKKAKSEGPQFLPRLLQSKQGFFVDKQGRRVNKHGWLQGGATGHLVDKFGRKKFDRKQLLADGDMPKLYNYQGKRFDIKNIMGIMSKDENGNIMPIQNKDGHLEDNTGQRVNERGYTVDRNGNIIDPSNQRVLWLAKHLKNGEFPKIFPYTKFNIKQIQGEFDLDPLGNPILQRDANGYPVDNKGRRVNARGYLINLRGDIVDKNGKLMFEAVVLDAEGDIPQVFRTGLLKSDTASSLSRLMSEIVRNQSSDFDQEERAMEQAIDEMKRGENGSGDTSVDSMMGDTPANYNIANQRFDQNDDDEYEVIPEEDDQANTAPRRKKKAPRDPLSPEMEGDMALKKIRRKKKKPKKKKDDGEKFLKPTVRDFQMAGVYGGDAHYQKARPGIKYEKERVLKGHLPPNTAVPVPAEFDIAHVGNLASTVSGFQGAGHQSINESAQDDQRSNRHAGSQSKVMRNKLVMDDRNSAEGMSQGPTSAHAKKMSEMRKKKAKKARQVGMKDGDFEKMFGENIDQFLEDSEWDVDSFDKMSHASKNSAQSAQNQMKLKAMEKVYLSRIETQNQGSNLRATQQNQSNSGFNPSGSAQRSSKKIPKVPSKKVHGRETQDRFTDDPDYIRRGQQWEFDTKKKNEGETNSSSKKKSASPLRGPIDQVNYPK